MFGQDEDDQPPTDGEQFDAVGRFEEPAEPTADDPGDAAESTATAPDSQGVHPKIKLNFWLLVGVFNVAFLAVGIGATLALLSDYQTLGRQVFIAGLVLFAYGAYRYRHAKAKIEEIVEEGDGIDGERDPDED